MPVRGKRSMFVLRTEHITPVFMLILKFCAVISCLSAVCLPSDVHENDRISDTERAIFVYSSRVIVAFLFEKITEIPLWPFAVTEKLPFPKTTQYIAPYFFISKNPAP